MQEKGDRKMVGMVLWSVASVAALILGGGAFTYEDASSQKNKYPYVGLGFLLSFLGLVFLAADIGSTLDYVQPTVPSEITSLDGQSFRFMGKIEVNNECGKHVVVARNESGGLVKFCTSQDVPDGIFKVVKNDPKHLYVPYTPFADANQAPAPSPVPSS